MCVLSFFYTSQEHTEARHKSGEDEEREEEETEEEEAEKLKKARDWDEFKDGEMINIQSDHSMIVLCGACSCTVLQKHLLFCYRSFRVFIMHQRNLLLCYLCGRMFLI